MYTKDIYNYMTSCVIYGYLLCKNARHYTFVKSELYIVVINTHKLTNHI